MRYWKFGSRWSYEGNTLTIKDVFMEYQTVFIGDDKNTYKNKFNNEVSVNDKFAISDGYTIVGIGLIKSKCISLDGMDIPKVVQYAKYRNFSHAKCIEDGYVIGFRALILLLKDAKNAKDAKDCIKYKSRRRFCAIEQKEIQEHIDAMCEKYNIPTYS